MNPLIRQVITSLFSLFLIVSPLTCFGEKQSALELLSNMVKNADKIENYQEPEFTQGCSKISNHVDMKNATSITP